MADAATRRTPVDIDRLRASLNGALADCLESWLPATIGGGPEGKAWRAASRRAGGPGDSLEVVLQGPRRGAWHHFGGDSGGDPLGLIAYAGNISMKDAWARARDMLGGNIPAQDEATAQARLEAARAAEAEEARKAEGRMKIARHILFRECRRDILGTPVEAYLLGRGLDVRKLPYKLGSLWFHPALDHPGTGTKMPAMVAGMVANVNGKAETVACHRTWLVRRGGDWDRLRAGDGMGRDGRPLNGKMSLGGYRDNGAAIRLWRGEWIDPETGEVQRGKPWSSLPPGSSITAVEGIENGLAVALMRPGRRVLTCVSLGGLASVRLPAAVKELTIAADNDAGNRQALGALYRAIEAQEARGHVVRVAPPPPEFKDWNDCLVGKKSKMVAA